VGVCGGLGESYPFLVVGDDAADEVGLGVVQGCHQLPQGLLVELAHSPEHPLLGLVDGLQAHHAVH